jgi:hypothetical protein
MKKVRSGLIALALTIGVAAAFANSSDAKAGKLTNFNWQTVDASGNQVKVADGGIYDPNRSLADAKADYGCSGLAATCASTVSAQDVDPAPTATYIRHN